MQLGSITLKQLKLLDAITRHNSFTLAAGEMYLSQSAVSQQIKGLEESVGQALFEKANNQIFLTEAGKIVVETARGIQNRMEQMHSSIEYLNGDITGALDIAVVTSAKYFLPRFLGEFLQLYPKVTPSLTVTNRASILESLANKRHNLYITGQIPNSLKVEAHPFLENILEVVASPDHPLCNEKDISLERIVKERFLVREKGSGTRKAINDFLASHKLTITPYMELGDTGAIKNAVLANLGIAVLSRHSIRLEHQTGRIAVLDVNNFPQRRHWYAIYPNKKNLSIVTKTFLDFLMSKNTM